MNVCTRGERGIGALLIVALAGCSDVMPTVPAVAAHGPTYVASNGTGPSVTPGGSGPAPAAASTAQVPSNANARSSFALGSPGAALAQSPGAPTSPYLVWTNTATGERVLWEMDASSYNGAQSSFGVGTTWQIVGTGDFSCDGKPDLLWRNASTGENVVWYMNGAAYSGQQAAISGVNTQWQIAAVADFNGDNMPDIVWQNSVTGERAIWRMNCTAYASQTSLGTVSTDWKIIAAADFTGDSQPDVIWQNSVTGERVIWHMNGATYTGSQTSFVVNTTWDIAGAADFTADGKPDIVWQNGVTGERVVWQMNGVAYAGQSPIGVVGTSWDISAIMALPGGGPLAPIVSILGITQNGAPANLGAASGALTITLNVDTKGQTLRNVGVTISCPSGTTMSATQVYAAPPAGSPSVTLNSSAFDATTGAGTLRNGSCSLVATTATGAAQNPYTGNSSALLLTLANVDGVFLSSTFAPFTNARGLQTITSATDANGFAWRGGSVTVNALPVFYSGALASIGSVQITLPGAATPTQTLTSAPYTATWSATATSGPNVNGITLYDLAQTEAGSTTPKGITPVIAATAVGGSPLALPVVNAATAAFRLDNTPPQPPLTFMTPRRQTTELSTYVTAWVGVNYSFSGTGAAGGIGAKGTTNYVACGDGAAMPIANPPQCGPQAGVSAAAVSQTTGTNGRTSFAYYMIPSQQYLGPPNSVTGTSATVSGCSLFGWTQFNTANDLAATPSSDRFYVVRSFESDALGNTRCTDLSWKPNVINSGVFKVGEFGVDLTPPVAQYAATAVPDQVIYNIYNYNTGNLVIDATEYGSGLFPKPVETKITRMALDYLTGLPVLPDARLSCPTGIVNGQCMSTMTDLSIRADGDGIIDANGFPYAAMADLYLCVSCGYYTITQTIADRAYNQAPTLTRSMLIDRSPPQMTQLCVCGVTSTGPTITGVAKDNLDLVSADYLIRYPVSPPGTGLPLNLRGQLAPMGGVAFDNVLTTSVPFSQNIAVPRTVTVTTGGGSPLQSYVAPTQLDVRATDAAGNTGDATVAMSAANFTQSPITNFSAVQPSTGGYMLLFQTTPTSVVNISNCPVTGCAGGASPVNPTSVTLSAQVIGARGANGFANPFTAMRFYYWDSTSGWILIGSVDQSNATVADNQSNWRTYTSSISFDPPASLGAGVGSSALLIIAVGISPTMDALVSAANGNFWLTNP